MNRTAIRSSRPASRLFPGVAAILFAVLWAGTAARAQTGPVMDYEYDAQGNPTKTTDALGRVTSMNYDALNRLHQTVQPAPDAGQRAPIIDTAYNPAGHLTAVTAYSTLKWTPIPRQTGHPVHGKLDSDSRANRTPVPGRVGHLK